MCSRCAAVVSADLSLEGNRKTLFTGENHERSLFFSSPWKLPQGLGKLKGGGGGKWALHLPPIASSIKNGEGIRPSPPAALATGEGVGPPPS